MFAFHKHQKWITTLWHACEKNVMTCLDSLCPVLLHPFVSAPLVVELPLCHFPTSIQPTDSENYPWLAPRGKSFTSTGFFPIWVWVKAFSTLTCYKKAFKDYGRVVTPKKNTYLLGHLWPTKPPSHLLTSVTGASSFFFLSSSRLVWYSCWCRGPSHRNMVDDEKKARNSILRSSLCFSSSSLAHSRSSK